VPRAVRTFGLTWRFYDMSNLGTAAKATVEIGKKNILDQRLRIQRQRALVARLERDGSLDLVADAVRILGEMEHSLRWRRITPPRRSIWLKHDK
jgi:hypothetical protein